MWDGCTTAGRLWETATPPGIIPSMDAVIPADVTPTIPGGYLQRKTQSNENRIQVLIDTL